MPVDGYDNRGLCMSGNRAGYWICSHCALCRKHTVEFCSGVCCATPRIDQGASEKLATATRGSAAASRSGILLRQQTSTGIKRMEGNDSETHAVRGRIDNKSVAGMQGNDPKLAAEFRARDPRVDCMDRCGDASSYFDVATYGQKSCTPTESSTAQGICMRHLTVAWHAVRTRDFRRASH